jgi:hypothetical protein
MIAPSSIEHQVVSRLLKAGFSPEAAAFYWAGADQSGGLDDILERIMDRVLSDQSADACAEEEARGDPSLNGEESTPFSGDGDYEPVGKAPVSAKTHGNFDVPLEEDAAKGAEEGDAGTYRILSTEEIRLLASQPDLDDEKPEVFPLHAVIGVMLEVVKDWMRHLQIPALLPVICALSAVSVALGRGAYVLSNKARTFPNIFGVLGGTVRHRKKFGVRRRFRSA